MKLIKNNWKKLTGILVVIAVLVFAYWYGGNAPGTKGFLLEEKSKQVSDQTADETTGVFDEGNGAESTSRSDISESTIRDTSDDTDYAGNGSSSGGYNQGTVNPSGKDRNYNSNVSINDDETYTDGNESDDNKPGNSSDDGNGGNDKTNRNPENEDGDNTENGNANDNDAENGGGNSNNSDGQKTPPDTGGGNTTETENPALYQKCTISIACNTILNNMSMLDKSKKSIVPADGWILKTVTVEFTTGETVFEVLDRVTKKYGIQLEYSYTPMYGSYYIEGIYNLYEFDCGNLSGWMYSVNGSFPNFGCSKYVLKDGDVIEWVYTCDLGADVGNPY